MTRARLLLALTVAGLVGCTDPAPAVEAAAPSRKAVHLAMSLVSYGMMNAHGRAQAGMLYDFDGRIKARALVCPREPGSKDATFFAWLSDFQGEDPRAVARALARESDGKRFAVRFGRLLEQGGRIVPLPDGCVLPDMPTGAPVLMIRTKIEGGPALKVTGAR